MKKWFLICCLVVLGAALLCLAGCDGAKESERLLSEIKNYGMPGIEPNRNIYYFLDCAIIPENSINTLSVLGFPMGVTTYQEMIEILKYDEIYWDYNYGHLVIEEEGSLMNHKWGFINACFLDGRLSAIQTRGLNEFPDTIEGFVEEFGTPNVVTWAGWLGERIAVWVEKGLIGNFWDTGGRKMIFLVPPMELSEFEGSWLSERIQYTPDYYDQDIKYSGDYYYLEEDGTNWYIREDPWGYTMNK